MRDVPEGFDPASSTALMTIYRTLLLLTSGIQAAGPRLTPASFAAGLQKVRFANPGAGNARYYQARVAFGRGDFAMTDSLAVVWWGETAPSYGGGGSGPTGGWCYMRRGARFDGAAWPHLEGELFDPDPRKCR